MIQSSHPLPSWNKAEPHPCAGSKFSQFTWAVPVLSPQGGDKGHSAPGAGLTPESPGARAELLKPRVSWEQDPRGIAPGRAGPGGVWRQKQQELRGLRGRGVWNRSWGDWKGLEQLLSRQKAVSCSPPSVPCWPGRHPAWDHGPGTSSTCQKHPGNPQDAGCSSCNPCPPCSS